MTPEAADNQRTSPVTDSQLGERQWEDGGLGRGRANVSAKTPAALPSSCARAPTQPGKTG